MAERVTKEYAQYRGYEHNPEHHCAVCSMFRKPHGCTYVEGHIWPQGSCKFFEAKH